MTVKFEVQLKIRKPVAEVFDAVANPKTLSRYFIETSSGPLVPGSTVMWKFPEFDGQVPVIVTTVEPDSRIAFDWPATSGDYQTHVEMRFIALDADNTMVKIAESGWPKDDKGLSDSHGNAGGWMHMLACMKAWLEYGINLREGGAV